MGRSVSLRLALSSVGKPLLNSRQEHDSFAAGQSGMRAQLFIRRCPPISGKRTALHLRSSGSPAPFDSARCGNGMRRWTEEARLFSGAVRRRGKRSALWKSPNGCLTSGVLRHGAGRIAARGLRYERCDTGRAIHLWLPEVRATSVRYVPSDAVLRAALAWASSPRATYFCIKAFSENDRRSQGVRRTDPDPSRRSSA